MAVWELAGSLFAEADTTCHSSCYVLNVRLTILEEVSMGDNRKLVFFHSPNTRSAGARVLLEELGAPYEMRVLNMKAGEQRGAEYLKINPMGKVPAVLHGDALITEQ